MQSFTFWIRGDVNGDKIFMCLCSDGSKVCIIKLKNNKS